MDGMPDPTPELPRSPEIPVEGPAELPGEDGALTLAAPPGWHERTAGWHERTAGWHERAAGIAGSVLLVLVVTGLGLMYGSRIALGSAAPAEAEALPNVAAPPALEADWGGLRFYRPPGSTAQPPDTELAPRVWIPRPRFRPRMAQACPGQPSAGC